MFIFISILQLILPYLNVKLLYYDLGLPYRDKTGLYHHFSLKIKFYIMF